MNDISVAFAKLAGARASVHSVVADADAGTRGRGIRNFAPRAVSRYFVVAQTNIQILRERMPELFGDFADIDIEPEVEMAQAEVPRYFERRQLEALIRLIDEAFEIRAHSELAAPEIETVEPRIFISHGRSKDWLEVQAFLERDLQYPTLELAQEPNRGRTVLEKLEQESRRCTFAVIVMTGDDLGPDGTARARQNVLHEIGFFQGRFGLSAVCLLHEEGTDIPSNIHGLVYIPFTKDRVSATFTALSRELRSFTIGSVSSISGLARR